MSIAVYYKPKAAGVQVRFSDFHLFQHQCPCHVNHSGSLLQYQCNSGLWTIIIIVYHVWQIYREVLQSVPSSYWPHFKLVIVIMHTLTVLDLGPQRSRWFDQFSEIGRTQIHWNMRNINKKYKRQKKTNTDPPFVRNTFHQKYHYAKGFQEKKMSNSSSEDEGNPNGSEGQYDTEVGLVMMC